jgi:hypothetical protein
MEDKMKVKSWWLFEHDGKFKCDRRNGRKECLESDDYL